MEAPQWDLIPFADPYIFPGLGGHLIELCTIRMSVGHMALDVSIPPEQGLRITTVISLKSQSANPKQTTSRHLLHGVLLSNNDPFSTHFFNLGRE